MTHERTNIISYGRMLYIYEGKEIREISKLLDVPLSTLYAICKKENWYEEREGKTLSPNALAEELKRSILLILVTAKKDNRPLTGEEGDKISKLSKARESIMRDSNYMGIAFDVFDKFQRHLKDSNADLLTVPLNNSIGDFLRKLLSTL